MFLMKKLILISCGCYVCSYGVHAQLPNFTIDTANKKSRINKYLNKTLPEGSFSHETSKGSVYILPYDNTPCLVPDMNNVAKMPGSFQPIRDNTMPNAIPRRRLIPKPNKN